MNSFSIFPIVAAATVPSMAIPGPYWLFTLLHWLTFSFHLIAMNTLFGGILLLLIFRSETVRGQLLPAMTKFFPTVMATAITLGVAPLLFMQVIYGRVFYAASIISGWNWFLLIPVVIIVYYLLYLVSMHKTMSTGTRVKLLLLAAIGFAYVSFTFTMVSDLAEKPDLWAGLYRSSAGGWSLNPAIDETIFRWLHIVVGALAVTGIFTQLLSLYHAKLRNNNEIFSLGGRMFMHGVIIGSILGLVYLFTLDSEIIRDFLASPGLHALITGIVLNIIALFFNFQASKSRQPEIKIWTSAMLVFAGVFCMVVARHSLRLVFLKGHFDPSRLPTNPQWLIFTLFILLFIAGLVTLYLMIKRFYMARGQVG